MFRKLTAFLMTLFLICLPLCACTTPSDVPEGMQAAHRAGEPFRLYLPEGWTLNHASGISGGYSYATERVIVHARYHTPSDPELTAADYTAQCMERYASVMPGFADASREGALLGGANGENLVNAEKLTYTATLDEVSYVCTQYAARHGDYMVTLHTYCPSDAANLVADTFELIRSNFVLTEREALSHSPLVDDATPEGMQIASGEDAAHRLYVPTSWVCDPESGKSEAYVDESGTPNVTVTLYEPQVSMSVEEYFTQCEERYREALGGYEFIEKEACRVAGRSAQAYTYRASYDGITFRIMQTVFSDGLVMYSLTYTALDDRFDAHLTDVEDIRDAFAFR